MPGAFPKKRDTRTIRRETWLEKIRRSAEAAFTTFL
jgi:hypothetical protein